MFLISIFTLGVLSFISSYFLVMAAIPFLRRRKIVDVPTQRRFNTKVKPRGAGIFLIPLILCIWIGVHLFLGTPNPAYLWGISFAGFLLLIISTIDDIKTIRAFPRLCVQIIACILGVYALGDTLTFQGYLPFWGDKILTFFCLLWFTNLYNFMDGVDGITGTQTTCITVGLASIMSLFSIGNPAFIYINIAIAGVALGFLIWNWAPSKILIGDSGSIPLGFLIGWLLLYTIGEGYFWATALLPLYYCMDATITLIGRMLRREKIWEPHRLHFFHRPVPHAYAHNQIVKRILGVNIILIACAHWVAAQGEFLPILPALCIGLGATLGLMIHFYSKRKR